MAIAFILTLAACTKSETVLLEDNGCIERSIIPVTAHSINDPDVSVVNDIFSTTGIDNNRFRYYQYVHDTFQTVDEQVVKVDQYTNGLRIFTGDLVYIFWNNSFHYRSGDITKGTSLGTLPQLKLGQIRWLFLNSIEQFDNTANKFKDSCFKAEFGYFNLNAGISYTQEDLVKAWRVTIKNSVSPSEYPIAYYRDKDGSLIYYDNGIRTFK
jgi:hypothetical protein